MHICKDSEGIRHLEKRIKMFINVFIRHYNFIYPKILILRSWRAHISKDIKIVNEKLRAKFTPHPIILFIFENRIIHKIFSLKIIASKFKLHFSKRTIPGYEH